LNGISSGGWVEYSKKMQEAGADALELNFYYVPASLKLTAVVLEKAYIQLVADIRAGIKIPLAVKLSPFYTALPQFASEIVKAGANALVCFNRFIQPDLDIENLKINPNLILSTSEELRLPLRWTAILFGKVKADIALTSGVHTAEDMVKAIMAGANVTMLASELIMKGPARAASLIAELSTWMEAHEYESVRQMLGSMSHKNVEDPAAFERGNYMKALQSFDNKLF
jgi:dihydroorotate dehydrogenase (fumarate)